METQPGSNGATVGGGEVSGVWKLLPLYTHWYHVIKHIVQMYGWGVGLICAINIPVGVSISDMYTVAMKTRMILRPSKQCVANSTYTPVPT